MCTHPMGSRYGYWLPNAIDTDMAIVCMACNELIQGYREYPEQSRGVILSMTPAQKGVANKRAKSWDSRLLADKEATDIGHTLTWEPGGRAFTWTGTCSKCEAYVYAGVNSYAGHAATLSCPETLRSRKRAKEVVGLLYGSVGAFDTGHD